MNRDELDQRLSRISTIWTMVFEAHGAEADSATAAMAGLAQRYSGVVYRYLLGAVRDPDAYPPSSHKNSRCESSGADSRMPIPAAAGSVII